MRFTAPEWFLLMPALILLAWWWRAGRLYRPLRAACLMLLVLLLAGPQWRRLESGLDLWVLVDQSASAEEALLHRLPEWEALLQRGMSTDDRLFFVDFADEAIMRGDDETLAFTGNRERTRLATAIRFSLAGMRTQRSSRLLVLTDGYSTEPVRDLAGRLEDQGVPLDFRLTPDAGGADYRVTSIAMPHRVQSGEPFLLDIAVTGQPDGEVPYSLHRDRRQVGQGQVAVARGHGRIRLAERIPKGGSHRYQVRLHPEDDKHPGNNSAERWIEVAGGPRILLVTNYTGDPLVPILQGQGFEVEVEQDPRALHPGRLTGARAVILNNVPADRIPPEFTAGLDFFVRGQGGGFLMAGGKQSFGAGGYFASAVEDLLPVSMELRQEHRRLSAAMAIVLDRSGSMAAGVAGGRTKMDLANAGAAQTIEMLGNGDAVTVFAVDSQPHKILPLTVLGDNRIPLTRAVRRITSSGGGIFVYTGLRAAWEELQQARQGQRHLILFADAQDAEEPGEYRELLEEMVAGGTTISVIGLGTDRDVDADFLQDIAQRGNGRIFFNADPSQLPAIFARETVAVARSVFVDEPAPVAPASGWLEIAGGQLHWPEAIDGYNLSYLKPEATAASFTADEHEAPLVAFWHRGIGRAAAITFPLGGEFSERARRWEKYGDFLQTLTRWVAGDDVPPGLGVRPSLDGERLSVELLYDEEWEQAFGRNGPELLVTRGTGGDIEEVLWERMEPGRYAASLPIEPSVPLRGAARAGNQVISFGPVTLGRSPEWDFDQARVNELKHLARLTGGEERLDLSRIWQSPRRRVFVPLQNPLLVILLLLVLAEILWTRLASRWRPAAANAGARLPAVPRTARSKRPNEKAASDRPSAPAAPPAPEEPPDGEVPAARRRERFDRAKRRGT